MSREEMEQDAADEAVVEEAPIEESEENGTEDAVEQIDDVDRLTAENAELKDKILRMAAENQNTRKRLVKQQQDAFKYRHQDILRDLAEVIDNFERAIDSSTESKDFDSFHEGIMMIVRLFSGMLTEKYGLEKVGGEGEPFDPSAHEAVMMEESTDVETDTVKQVYQTGYRLHDRVLRPAKVVVFKPAVVEDGTENAEDQGE